MTDGDAFYLPLGDNRYEPTRAPESPWDRDAQHGGPPAALLAHLIDATVEEGLRLARPRRRAPLKLRRSASDLHRGPRGPASDDGRNRR
jgi:hypothetical protein